MANDPLHVLVTGGAGFIGSHLVDLLLERQNTKVTVLDKLTYAGTTANLADHDGDPRFRFVRGDVADPAIVEPLVAQADRVVHSAAESFVDRSIEDSRAFVVSNVLGTQVMLEACREAGKPMLLVSTDEVYGSRRRGRVRRDGPDAAEQPVRREQGRCRPAVPLLRRHLRHAVSPSSAGRTRYGPRQHPGEGDADVRARAAQEGRPAARSTATGRTAPRVAVRPRLRPSDRDGARSTGEPGGVYNIGGGTELSNLELAQRVCRFAGAPESLITFVPDRPGHDFRYGLRVGTARARSAGAPSVACSRTAWRSRVAWYREHRDWVEAILEGRAA